MKMNINFEALTVAQAKQLKGVMQNFVKRVEQKFRDDEIEERELIEAVEQQENLLIFIECEKLL